MCEHKSCLHAQVVQATAGIKSEGSSVGELVSNKLTGRMLLSNQTYQIHLLLFGSLNSKYLWCAAITAVVLRSIFLLCCKRHNQTSHRPLSERPAPSRFPASLPAKQWPLPSARWWQLFCFALLFLPLVFYLFCLSSQRISCLAFVEYFADTNR